MNEEQLDMLMYGVCLVCGATRKTRLTRNGEAFDPVAEPPRQGDGNTYELSVLCPNGHDQ